jgi:hypothetical protein
MLIIKPAKTDGFSIFRFVPKDSGRFWQTAGKKKYILIELDIENEIKEEKLKSQFLISE